METFGASFGSSTFWHRPHTEQAIKHILLRQSSQQCNGSQQLAYRDYSDIGFHISILLCGSTQCRTIPGASMIDGTRPSSVWTLFKQRGTPLTTNYHSLLGSFCSAGGKFFFGGSFFSFIPTYRFRPSLPRSLHFRLEELYVIHFWTWTGAFNDAAS